MFNNNFGNVFAGSASTDNTTVASYKASTKRDIRDELIASYSASTKRDVNKLTIYSALTQRTLNESTSYSGSSQRKLQAIDTYSALTQRTVGESSFYSATTERTVGESAIWNADTRRRVKGDPDLYWTDFSEYITGEEPYDWTNFSDNTRLVVQEDVNAEGGKRLEGEGDQGGRFFLWDQLNSSTNPSEIAILFKAPSDGSTIRITPLLRAIGGSSSVSSGYVLDFQTFNNRWVHYVYRKNNLQVLTVENTTTDVPISIVDGNEYWIRFRVENNSNGEPVCKSKIWEKNSEEPDWQLIDISTTYKYNDTGVGLRARSETKIDVFSVGTNGKFAQLEPTLVATQPTSYFVSTSRVTNKLTTHNALTERISTELSTYNGDTLREITGTFTVHYGATQRTVHKQSIDTFSTERTLQNSISNQSSTSRTLHEFNIQSSATKRATSKSTSYVGLTHRVLNEATSYKGDTDRYTLKPTSFNADTERKTADVTGYIGSTSRTVFKLNTYSALTSRELHNTALYHGGTIRELTKPIYYFTDFSEYTTGQEPSDWTRRWKDGTAVVEDDPDSIGGKRLRASGSNFNSQWAGMSWDLVNDAFTDEVEVLMLYTPNGYNAYSFVRGDNPTSFGQQLQYFYGLSANDDTLRGYRMVNDNIQATQEVFTPSITPNKKYWTRLRAEGDTFKGKIWQEGTQEPEGWVLLATHTDPQDGFVGIVQYGTSDAYIDVFAVATNGGTARGYESGLSGATSYSAYSERRIGAPIAQLFPTQRITTEFTNYIGSTQRLTGEFTFYSGDTTRQVNELTVYSGDTRRDVTLMFATSYFADVERIITAPTNVIFNSERILTEATGVIGGTSREIHGLSAYNSSTQRELRASTTYNGYTGREIHAETSYNADGTRKLHQNLFSSFSTDRITTEYTFSSVTTLRKVVLGAFYSADTYREVFQEGNFRVKCNVERIILVGSSYSDIYNDKYRTYDIEEVSLREYALRPISRELVVQKDDREATIEFETRTLNVKYK